MSVGMSGGFHCILCITLKIENGTEMSGAETARRRIVQRRVGGAETAAPKWPSPYLCMSIAQLSGTVEC